MSSTITRSLAAMAFLGVLAAGCSTAGPAPAPTQHPHAVATPSRSPAAPATPQAAHSTKPATTPHKHARKPHRHKAASQPAAPPSSQPAAQPANPIPQGNGADHDADNNGGPSDGDGNI